jgi:hypothetical protein
MRLLSSLTFFCCLYLSDASAQVIKKYKINPGEKIVEVIPANETYSYYEFMPGKVYLKNNTVSLVQLNYNSILGEMQFIDPKGDTLSLADEKMIKVIVVNNDTFYFENVYLRLIENEGKIKLANNQYCEIVNKEKMGEFGQPGRGSIETFTTMSSNSSFSLKDLVVNEVITIAKKSYYYISDESNNYKVANKKNLLEMFPKNETEIKAYLKENKVDFYSEKDMKKLVVFLKRIIPTMPL